MEEIWSENEEEIKIKIIVNLISKIDDNISSVLLWYIILTNNLKYPVLLYFISLDVASRPIRFSLIGCC